MGRGGESTWLVVLSSYTFWEIMQVEHFATELCRSFTIHVHWKQHKDACWHRCDKCNGSVHGERNCAGCNQKESIKSFFLQKKMRMSVFYVKFFISFVVSSVIDSLLLTKCPAIVRRKKMSRDEGVKTLQQSCFLLLGPLNTQRMTTSGECEVKASRKLQLRT